MANREDIEARIARILGKVNREAYDRIKELLGDPPKAQNLSGAAWEEIRGMYDRALLPQLETVYHDAAEGMLSQSSIGVDWNLINKRAADWARSYTYDLVSGIVDNSRASIQDAVGDFYAGRLDLGALQDRLGRVFSPVRAEMIAITETTRAAAQGEAGYVDELRKLGAVMVAVWNSENDGSVCPLCAPLNGKRQGDGWRDLPPRHPRCRCNVSYEAVLPDEYTPTASAPTTPYTMPYGADIPIDVGTPGKTQQSLNTFLNNSDGALARALKGIDDDDFENSLLNLNFDTDQFEVNKDAVKYQADVFLNESRYMVNYNKSYLMDMVQERLTNSGINITDPLQLEEIYNRDYAYKAKAILTAADVGNIKLTVAQRDRLNNSADMGYLDMVLTEKYNRTKYAAPEKMKGSGDYSASDSARRQKRQDFLEVLGRLDLNG